LGKLHIHPGFNDTRSGVTVMSKRSFIFVIVSVLAVVTQASCGDPKATRDEDDSKEARATNDSIPLNSYNISPAEAGDDTVFNDGSKPISWLNAGITDSVAAKLFVKKLQGWARDNHVDSIGTYLNYPLRNPAIPDRKDFKLNYGNYFTDGVKAALADQNLRQIFRTQQGFMIGQGQIWMREINNNIKIIAINN
jgi:hypothetical protein